MEEYLGETALPGNEYFSPRRKKALLRLARHTLFEQVMEQVDNEGMTREQAIATIRVRDAAIRDAEKLIDRKAA